MSVSICIYLYTCMLACISVGYKQTFWLEYKLAHKLGQSYPRSPTCGLVGAIYVCLHALG